MTKSRDYTKLSDSEILHVLLQKVDGLDDKIGSLEDKVDENTKRLDHHEDMILSLTQKVVGVSFSIDYIKEQLESIPKIYNLVDKITSRTVVDEQERVFLSNKVNGHEDRLVVVENALSITPNLYSL